MLTASFLSNEILWPHGFERGVLSLSAGLITQEVQQPSIDLAGYMILPGMVDVHGDAFERHIAPRRGLVNDRIDGILATEAEVAANGITTAVLPQFWSWEGGIRSPEFAESFFQAMRSVRGRVATSLIGQLRLEVHMVDDFERLPDLLSKWDVNYVVFNDHLPPDILLMNEQSPRIVRQALRAKRSPIKHYRLLSDLRHRRDGVPAAVDRLARKLRNQSVLIGTHDEADGTCWPQWSQRGAKISEFPITAEAAVAAKRDGALVVIGAPNVVRGGSHNGNLDARELVAAGLVDVIASDYHYPSLLQAIKSLNERNISDFSAAWSLVSSKPAALLGLSDRGQLSSGLRADIVVLHQETGRVAATIAGGCVSYLSGPIAERFMANGVSSASADC
ncbi:MAG: alpha-D-ribose 1-methylphosphonate 5-triphosphate diphosphatase [Aestuariivita sp.]|nr:alpha-D-ribose 1-methylphosphonate 5-triphosphate diphosphatase [Aestuariivita sp.]